MQKWGQARSIAIIAGELRVLYGDLQITNAICFAPSGRYRLFHRHEHADDHGRFTRPRWLANMVTHELHIDLRGTDLPALTALSCRPLRQPLFRTMGRWACRRLRPERLLYRSLSHPRNPIILPRIRRSNALLHLRCGWQKRRLTTAKHMLSKPPTLAKPNIKSSCRNHPHSLFSKYSKDHHETHPRRLLLPRTLAPR